MRRYRRCHHATLSGRTNTNQTYTLCKQQEACSSALVTSRSRWTGHELSTLTIAEASVVSRVSSLADTCGFTLSNYPPATHAHNSVAGCALIARQQGVAHNVVWACPRQGLVHYQKCMSKLHTIHNSEISDIRRRHSDSHYYVTPQPHPPLPLVCSLLTSGNVLCSEKLAFGVKYSVAKYNSDPTLRYRENRGLGFGIKSDVYPPKCLGSPAILLLLLLLRRLPGPCDSSSSPAGRPLQKRTQTAEACGPAQVLPLLKGEPNQRVLSTPNLRCSCTGSRKVSLRLPRMNWILPRTSSVLATRGAIQEGSTPFLAAPSTEELDPASHHVVPSRKGGHPASHQHVVPSREGGRHPASHHHAVPSREGGRHPASHHQAVPSREGGRHPASHHHMVPSREGGRHPASHHHVVPSREGGRHPASHHHVVPSREGGHPASQYLPRRNWTLPRTSMWCHPGREDTLQ
ncbi:uncharacterized protein LOC123500061 [Portunus trituberculatus]|uniref:uncharacterized protein LOC123500061 n=1 Tax=Portunus trituberculatus TaxID=210409 RepID=UPI001E1D0EC9|nr:uncharacterized protein LOC123500061 [Portunus trituberculatus]